MNHKETNLQIISALKEYVENNPELRFNQILWALRIVESDEGIVKDNFYEDPKITLDKIIKFNTKMNGD